MDASHQIAYEWREVNWKQIQADIFKLQKRIYRASQEGNVKLVHNLQRLLIKSKAAALLAVRRVSQDNHGKKTAGIDGVKELTPPQRLALAEKIHAEPYQTKAKAVRRVWIAKANRTGEFRPLGIPIMEERARQALLKLALEPEWEARFEPNSYGFRPGRSAHDAISYLFTCLRQCPKYVLDADIAKCFDRINHEALLDKLKTFPQMRRTIKAWLQAGILDGETLFPSSEGTPQGGVISPLLANIALHGLETYLQSKFPRTRRIANDENSRLHWRPQVVRYADDFVILHPNIAVIEEAKRLVEEWLEPLGLKLNEAKTHITHTLWYGDERPGFDFLGFHIRQHKACKNRQPNSRHGKLPFTTKVVPSKQSLQQQSRKITEILRSMRACPQEQLVATLNPIITGWGRYFGICHSESKNKLDNQLLYFGLKRWARRRHPKKHWGWVARKYWRLETGKWTFGAPHEIPLQSHYQKVERLHPIGSRSPFDGDWAYWLMRGTHHPDLSPTKAKLYRFQAGKCQYCGLHFQAGDCLEIDHLVPFFAGGRDISLNRQLLHRHCHDAKTLEDIRESGTTTLKGGINDK
ncbi:MAG TPA: group II intron reverse transcriptase/maturase [Blastocatellia bacterium]|nr:group II intron reverse transcriptase/maturase [Blastocatellia bacterium]